MHASKDSMWRGILKNFAKFWKLNTTQTNRLRIENFQQEMSESVSEEVYRVCGGVDEWHNHPVRLLVSASPNQSANSVFLSQQTSTSQPKPTQKPSSEQAEFLLYISHD